MARQYDVVVFGDLIVDRTIWVEPVGLSPETGTTYYKQVYETITPGGAANVAANLRALSAGRSESVALIARHGVAGRAAGLPHAPRADLDTDWLVTTPRYETPVKTRYLLRHETAALAQRQPSSQLFRSDQESSADAAELGVEEEECLSSFIDVVRRFTTPGAVFVLSDYGKGVVTPRLARDVISAARGRLVLIDPPKASNWKDLYWGRNVVLKPNLYQAHRHMTGETLHSPLDFAACRNLFIGLVRDVIDSCGCGGVLMTAGAYGGFFSASVGDYHWWPAKRVPGGVVDVCGAGDAVLAQVANYMIGKPLNSENLCEAALRGTCAGSYACSVAGVCRLSYDSWKVADEWDSMPVSP